MYASASLSDHGSDGDGGGTDPLADPLSCDPLASIRARGRVALRAHVCEGRTRRASLREEGALRLRFPAETASRLDAVAVNVAGGMAGGDVYEVEIVAQAGAQVTFATASAEKVYRALGAPTRADLRLRAEAGARLAALPQETILFDGARLRRRVEIDLQGDARLVLCDLLVLGRAAMGEEVRTLDWADQWRLRRDGALVWADAARLQGDATARLASGATGAGARAFGLVLYAAPDAQSHLEPLRESLAQAGAYACEAGASCFDDLLLARFVAPDALGARRAMERALRLLPDGSPPRSWST
jgi:urease accessory protein